MRALRLSGALALLATLSCAAVARHEGLTTDVSALAVDPSWYPDEDAVVLSLDDRYVIHLVKSEGHTEITRHVAIALLKEAALESVPEVRVVYSSRATLKRLDARIIDPNGQVRPVDAEAMLVDAKQDDERAFNVKSFRFPAVKVGSVIEYESVLEYPFADAMEEQAPMGRMPVRHYSLTVQADSNLEFELKGYGSTAPFGRETLADGSRKFTWHLNDVPGREGEDFDPHWTFTEPHWAFRITARTWSLQRFPWIATWKDAVEYEAKLIFIKGHYDQGLTLRVSTDGCAGPTCFIDRARALLREKVAYGHERSFTDLRTLKTVVAEGDGASMERALLLRKLLADTGLDARLALTTGKLDRAADPEFPLLSPFTDLLVYLPVQAGLAAPLWLDASCDHCAVGEVNEELVGASALVFRAVAQAADPRIETEWKKVDARRSRVGTEYRVEHSVGIDAAGAMTQRSAEFWRGSYVRSRVRLLRAESDTEYRKHQRKVLAGWLPSATLTDVEKRECDTALGECALGRVFKVPDFARVDGPRLEVPLLLLVGYWGNLFAPDERTTDVHFSTSDRRNEKARIEVPAGFRLVNAPGPIRVKAGNAEATFEVVATATGAEVMRSLSWALGVVKKDRYRDLQKVTAAWADARLLSLTFVKDASSK